MLSYVLYKLKQNDFIFNIADKLNNPKFFYEGKINFNPFYSILKGESEEINLFKIFNSNTFIIQLLKTEILNNKNMNFDLKINSDKIKSFESFIKFNLNSKIEDGLTDIDNSKFSWKNNASFEITDSLIHVKEGELILDGKLNISISDSNEIYKFLLTPKNYRTKIREIELNFYYNFDKHNLGLDYIKIDKMLNKSINNDLKILNFKNNKLQNKIYFKNIMNKFIKLYAG